MTNLSFTRYETRNFEKNNDVNMKPLETNFSHISLNTDEGKVTLADQGSQRLTSMTQRVMERKTFTSTTESRSERKTEKHSFRME